MKKNIFKTLAVTVLSAVSLTAWAVEPYAGLVNTTTEITFDGKAWYLIEDNSTAANAGTVTLLTKECVGTSAYNSSGSYVEYSNSTVKTAVDAYYTDNISAAAKEAVSDDKMFLLTKDQESTIYNANPDVLKCNQFGGTPYNIWWLCSPSYKDERAMCVDGDGGYLVDGPVTWSYGVRPALKLDLSKVTFDTETKTFSVAPTTSVATPTLSPADAAKSNIWYDLNGRHYQGKPTMQ
nr:hypothetical protein [Paludibacteraceae bacterium]